MPKITEAEWHLLEVLWEKSPLSAREIHDVIPPSIGMAQKTIRTLLGRLFKKKVVTRSQVHGIYVFRPNVERSICVQERGRQFLDLFFGGKPEMLFSHFLRSESLDPNTIERLRIMLDEKIDDCEKNNVDGE